MSRVLATLFVVLALLHSASAIAAAYSWTYPGSEPFGSPSGACLEIREYMTPPSTSYKAIGQRVVRFNDVQYDCYIKFQHNDDANEVVEVGPVHILRNGDTCPPGQVLLADQANGTCGCPAGLLLDELTQECVPEPSECESRKGQLESFYASSLSFTMCRAGCELGMDSLTPFKRTVSSEVVYHYTGAYTGESCPTDSPSLDGCNDCEAPPPTESTHDEQCTETVDTPEGKRSSCNFTDTTKDNIDCVAKGGSLGEFKGAQTCVAQNKGPKT